MVSFEGARWIGLLHNVCDDDEEKEEEEVKSDRACKPLEKVL